VAPTPGTGVCSERMDKHPAHILELAKLGAEVQLRDLMQEIRYLLELFPHLRDSFDEDELPLRYIMARDAGQASKSAVRGARRRRTLPGGVRRAASQRKRNYVSAQRKPTKDS
jgi:hypothetical protein